MSRDKAYLVSTNTLDNICRGKKFFAPTYGLFSSVFFPEPLSVGQVNPPLNFNNNQGIDQSTSRIKTLPWRKDQQGFDIV